MTDHSDLIADAMKRYLRISIDQDWEGMKYAILGIDEAAKEIAALSSQSLSLSEAREEIERLKGLVAGIRECPQETITGVALLYDDGRIIALPRPHRHHHLYAFAAFIGQQPDEHESGFTTSTGRYVDREEAQRICVAAGQPNRRSGSQHDPKLYSEDVW